MSWPHWDILHSLLQQQSLLTQGWRYTAHPLIGISKWGKAQRVAHPKKVSSQMVLHFPTSPDYWYCTTCGKKKPKIAPFHINAECCFANRHRKHIHIIIWSQLNCPSFSQESAVCNKHSMYSMLLSVTTHSSLSWCRLLCQKRELFFVEPQVKSEWTVLVGYLTISTNVNCIYVVNS